MTFTSVLKAFALAVPLALTSVASAAPITGSIFMGSASVTTSGPLANLLLLAPFNAVAGLSTGDFAAADLPPGSAMIVSASALQPSSPADLMLSATGFGTFTASSLMLVNKGQDSLDIMFVGSFDPQFGAGAFSDDQAATLRLEVNRTGTVANITGTLALAATATGSGANPGTGTSVPEPASMALLGVGLAGVGLLRRRWLP